MLKNLRALLASLLRTSPRADRRRRFVPGLEWLEHRAVPATFMVTTTLDTVAADGKLSLREAVSAANARTGADTIVLPAGVYRLSLAGADNTNAAGDLDVLGTTLFRGAGAGATVIDGQRIDRVFDILGTAPSSIQVTFQGLAVRNGLADAGGGIRVGNANLMLRDCAVTANRAIGDGGGISDAALPGTGNVTLLRGTVSRNVAGGDGGGINAGTAKLTNSTVSGNHAGSGGGISAEVATLTNSTVTSNHATGAVGDAGGIFANTRARLTGSTVSGNSATRFGGGIVTDALTLTRSTVSGNLATRDGGGIDATTADLTNSTVTGNHSGGEGGGVRAAITATLTTSTVSGNTGTDGGGVWTRTLLLTASTVSGNHATNGGGVFAGITAMLTDGTVSGNSAAALGGGIFATSLNLFNVTVTDNIAHSAGGVFLRIGGTSSVRNTIIAANLVDFQGTVPDVSGDFTSGGHNLIGDGSGSTGFLDPANSDQMGTTANPIDARLAPLANNGGATRTHALLPGSPAIDQGDNTVIPTTDQRGVARVRDGDGNRSRVVDIGAFER